MNVRKPKVSHSLEPALRCTCITCRKKVRALSPDASGIKYLARKRRSQTKAKPLSGPPGTPHKWWNAGTTELRMTGWCSPPDNVEFFLSALFASTKQNGGRPALFDAAFLMMRYRSEYAMLELPAFVRHGVLPVLYFLGRVLGRYHKYRDAPEPVTKRVARTTRKA